MMMIINETVYWSAFYPVAPGWIKVQVYDACTFVY